MKKALLPFVIILPVIGIDQWLKYWVSHAFPIYSEKVLIPKVLEFAYLHNDGAAMGMLSGGRWFLIGFTALLLLGCLAYLLFGKHQSFLLRFSLSLIIGGGIGNLIDRIFLGYVVDFVRFPIPWFSYSFNIADCAVCIGCGLLILDLILDIFKSKKQSSAIHEEA